ncbi:hypothetical protein B0A55_00254 [Friedmanniomyces simplex]|uniref:Prokaryotic-type class I peptide chain release factors domain-containing protein n=1 Tax=Friedmanniomyces simplex TaxID=329884 RepID=A0A4V5NIP8_9PEZI|nr:hypothetical protein B0A55_00254 [Friedmanniomyces simplex]
MSWQFTGTMPSAVPGNISPALLSRARTIAQEHATLTNRLATEYDANAAKRLGELQSTSSAVKQYDKASSALEELQSILQSPDKELRELAEDDVQPTRESVENASAALRSSLVPVHPFAHLPCLVEIRPGAGGDEAALFAGDLVRMYEGYCARVGLRSALLKYETAEGIVSSAGAGGSHVQEAILEVDSPGAYGMLRCEAGVHRVQRVPATESKGRTHTSAASVLVLPSIAAEGGSEMEEHSFNDPKSDYYVDPKDVKIDVMRAGGAGGQHVNRTESAVRLTHLPTGTVVAMQDSRSQLENREKAWRLLRSRLAQQRRDVREEELARLRRGAGAGKAGRENKVRTYNWGQQRVSDHRSGLDVRNLDDVMGGGDALERVMESHKPPKPRKSATYVLHFFTNLIHAPSSESLAATETTLEVSMRPTAMMDSRTTVLTSLTSSSTKTSPLLSGAPINATAAKLCISARGGVQGDNSVAAGCGAIFQHLTTCFDSLGPWIDPYNTTQSTSFQACMCETNATSPFDTNSLLWRNFIGCSSCLEMFSAGISLDTLAQEFLSIEDFCRSQNPVACLALASFETWLAAINEGTTLPTPPLTGGITQLAALSSAFTTTPPLANLAYGASAPFDGTLADVTPQLMTQTITVPPTGTTSGSSSLQVITMLVDWVATATATGCAEQPVDDWTGRAVAAVSWEVSEWRS